MFSYKANAICMASMTMPAGAGVAASHCWNRVQKPGQLINYAPFSPHRWTFAENRTAHAQTLNRKSTQWQWASFVSAADADFANFPLKESVCILYVGSWHPGIESGLWQSGNRLCAPLVSEFGIKFHWVHNTKIYYMYIWSVYKLEFSKIPRFSKSSLSGVLICNVWSPRVQKFKLASCYDIDIHCKLN